MDDFILEESDKVIAFLNQSNYTDAEITAYFKTILSHFFHTLHSTPQNLDDAFFSLSTFFSSMRLDAPQYSSFLYDALAFCILEKLPQEWITALLDAIYPSDDENTDDANTTNTHLLALQNSFTTVTKAIYKSTENEVAYLFANDLLNLYTPNYLSLRTYQQLLQEKNLNVFSIIDGLRWLFYAAEHDGPLTEIIQTVTLLAKTEKEPVAQYARHYSAMMHDDLINHTR